MAQNTPSNVIDASALFAARRDAGGSAEDRKALAIRARLERFLELEG